MNNFNWFEFNLDSFLLLFIVLNVVNVIIQTFKAIITINGSPLAAAGINAITFAIYTVVVVFMNADGLGIVWKSIIIGIVNFIGVYVVKWLEVKSRKDKLWKVEATVDAEHQTELITALRSAKIPFNYIEGIGKYVLFNIYCETQKQSKAVKLLLDFNDARYFVAESKTL